MAVDARVVAADGTVLPDKTLLWRSDNEEHVTVDGGRVATGSVVQIAGIGRLGATVSVTVEGEPQVLSTRGEGDDARLVHGGASG